MQLDGFIFLSSKSLVRKKTRMISLILIMLLGLTVLKNLLPGMLDTQAHDCNEFGHIHISFLQKISHRSELTTQQKSAASTDQTCHAGQSIFSYSLLPVMIYEIKNGFSRIEFKTVLIQENYFDSPFLDVPRQPPKA
jgi:hypothetical protein